MENVGQGGSFCPTYQLVASNKELAKRLDELEKKYDTQFKVVFDAIRQIVAAPASKEKKIGFVTKERRAVYKIAKKAAT